MVMDRDIMVFGFGVSCFSVAAFLDRELFQSVGRIVVPGKLEDMSDLEIETVVLAKLRPHIGKTRLIVIYDPFLAVLLQKRLAAEFPKQKFAYPSIELIYEPCMSREMKIRLVRQTRFQELRIENNLAVQDVPLWNDRGGNEDWANKCILKGVKGAMAGRDKMTP